MTQASGLDRTDNKPGLEPADFSTYPCALHRAPVSRPNAWTHGSRRRAHPSSGANDLRVQSYTELSDDHLVSSSADVHGAPGIVEKAGAIMGKLCAPRGSEQLILVALVFR